MLCYAHRMSKRVGCTLCSKTTKNRWMAAGETQLGGDSLQAVLPLRGERLWRWQGRTQVMGILNATPDSFSDGGQGPEAVLARARVLVGDGADVLDVGGQSTRPGASPVSVEEDYVVVELGRG